MSAKIWAAGCVGSSGFLVAVGGIIYSILAGLISFHKESEIAINTAIVGAIVAVIALAKLLFLLFRKNK